MLLIDECLDVAEALGGCGGYEMQKKGRSTLSESWLRPSTSSSFSTEMALFLKETRRSEGFSQQALYD